jgi:hypothetical protein
MVESCVGRAYIDPYGDGDGADPVVLLKVREVEIG